MGLCAQPQLANYPNKLAEAEQSKVSAIGSLNKGKVEGITMKKIKQ